MAFKLAIASILLSIQWIFIVRIPQSEPKLVLMPDQGKMHCNVVKRIGGVKNVFALTIPETIGSRQKTILNFPSTRIKWIGPDEEGIVSTSWTTRELVKYELILIPNYDFVDAKMTISNLSDSTWYDVWSFNCLNPTRAETFKDSTLNRTFMSTSGGPMPLSKTTRVTGTRPTIGVYFNENIDDPENYAFVRDFEATSPNRTNGDYLVTLSEDGNSYMAATSQNALFLFDNLKFKCIHSAANFGNIEPGQSKTMVSRFYFASGNLDSFITRYFKDRK